MNRAKRAGNVLVLCSALLLAAAEPDPAQEAGALNRDQDARPDLSVTNVFAGPASEARFCIGITNSVYVTVRREGGSGFAGPIPVWLLGRGVAGQLPMAGLEKIDYVRGAHSWLVIFRNVRVAGEWRSADPLFTAVVNPEIDGRRSIVESNYYNNSYTLKLDGHTDWSRKCT